MELNEKDGLITLERKKSANKTYLLVGTVFVVCVVAIVGLAGSTNNRQPNLGGGGILRAEAPSDANIENVPAASTVIENAPNVDNAPKAVENAPTAVDNPPVDENAPKTVENGAEAPKVPKTPVEVMSTTPEIPSTTRDRFDFIRRLIGSRNNSTSAPTVSLSLGKIEGVNLKSREGREYFGFYNVPYAQKPLGELRFMPPVAVEAWNGTLDGKVKGTMCVQKSRYNPNVTVEGTEDCLHSNIFTPKLPRRFGRRNGFPVIAYFFGGGFMHGTANDFSAEYLMDEDVVIVVVESRVGALGFLNTGDSLATGNQGLKDQVQAIRFIKEHIADFGGDPERITAFGTSSGAMCAHSHLISPMTNGLISGAMSFSGTVLMPGATFNTDPLPLAQDLGRSLNCTNVEDTKELLSCLRSASFWDIAEKQPSMGFTPSLETLPEDGNLENVFFPDSPINLIMNGQTKDIPWLVGVNDAESILQSYSLLLDENAVEQLNTNFEETIKSFMNFPNRDENDKATSKDIIASIKSLYFNNFKEKMSKDSNLRFNLTNLIGDRMHYHPTHVAGLMHANTSPVFWYYLTKEANKSFAADVIQYFDPPYGVSHADEVQYIFLRDRYPAIPTDSEWFSFSKMFVKYIVAFATDGVPSNPDYPAEWPEVDGSSNGTIWFNLDDEPGTIEPFTERMEFWDSLPFQFLYNSTTITN